MTVMEKIVEILLSKGMDKDDAGKVVEKVVPEIEKIVPGHNFVWDGPSGKYPSIFYSAIWLTLKQATLEWIDENCPDVWFRIAFV